MNRIYFPTQFTQLEPNKIPANADCTVRNENKQNLKLVLHICKNLHFHIFKHSFFPIHFLIPFIFKKFFSRIRDNNEEEMISTCDVQSRWKDGKAKLQFLNWQYNKGKQTFTFLSITNHDQLLAAKLDLTSWVNTRVKMTYSCVFD